MVADAEDGRRGSRLAHLPGYVTYASKGVDYQAYHTSALYTAEQGYTTSIITHDTRDEQRRLPRRLRTDNTRYQLQLRRLCQRYTKSSSSAVVTNTTRWEDTGSGERSKKEVEF